MNTKSPNPSASSLSLKEPNWKKKSKKDQATYYNTAVITPEIRKPLGYDDFIMGQVPMDTIILKGKARFHPDAWGKPYRSKVYTNPTVKDLLVEFERGIRATGDNHHLFLEGIDITPAKNKNGVALITLAIGS